jgi:putative CocE/NonD family hydrolase
MAWLGLVVLAGLTVSFACRTAGPTGPDDGQDHHAGRHEPQTDEDIFPPPEERERQVSHFRENYIKHKYRIPMRDGVRLFTVVYAPKNTSQTYPILMRRTPYSVAPYGPDKYPEYPWYLGPPRVFAEEGFIFVYQDVRGRFMSEGQFVNMRPHIENKTSESDIDESTDTYDTVEWLLANIPNHNGRVGLWGISYPGFYAAAGMIDAHPAIAAVSPQAPIADWFFDDFHHHGAFFLTASFNFFFVFGPPRPELTTEWGEQFDHGTPDGYQFFLDLGPVKNANERYFKGNIPFWNAAVEHPNYDEFWQDRNILPHLRNVAPAVMTVGGWFDAEDLYGPLKIYQAVEERNPGIFNMLVMGPWFHGGWDRSWGEKVGNIHFGSRTSEFYRQNIELPFFNHFLKGKGKLDLPEATVFDTGANRWHSFDVWPPPHCKTQSLYFSPGGRLSFDPPAVEDDAYDEYISDPQKPVPVTLAVTTDIPKAYMTDDQRFAARRPDVLAYQTEPLAEDLTLAGSMVADLWVSTSGSASDWVVKLIDVFPPDAPDRHDTPPGVRMGGYQMMVRSEIIRGRFRNSYQHPEPFLPGQPTRVTFELLDILHTFKRGHRIMVQVQSSWFPMVDRNPQSYVDNIFLADEEDFIKTTQRVYRSARYPSRLQVNVLSSTKMLGSGR